MSESHDSALDAELAALAPQLDRIAARAPSDALVERTRSLACAELARAPSWLPGVAAPSTRLPDGFAIELTRLAVTVLPALTLGAFWAAALLRLAPGWLAAWVPVAVGRALVLGPSLVALTALGLASASLPLLAHRRALLRTRGAIA